MQWLCSKEFIIFHGENLKLHRRILEKEKQNLCPVDAKKIVSKLLRGRKFVVRTCYSHIFAPACVLMWQLFVFFANSIFKINRRQYGHPGNLRTFQGKWQAHVSDLISTPKSFLSDTKHFRKWTNVDKPAIMYVWSKLDLERQISLVLVYSDTFQMKSTSMKLSIPFGNIYYRRNWLNPSKFCCQTFQIRKKF